MPFQSWSIPEASNAPAAHSVCRRKDQSATRLWFYKLFVSSGVQAQKVGRIHRIFRWQSFMPFQSWSIPEASNAPAAHSVLQAKRPVDYKIVVLRVE